MNLLGYVSVLKCCTIGCDGSDISPAHARSSPYLSLAFCISAWAAQKRCLPSVAVSVVVTCAGIMILVFNRFLGILQEPGFAKIDKTMLAIFIDI